MFDLSPEKIVVLGVIALVVLGPDRLPVFARKAGRVISEVRRMSGSFQDELKGALVEPRQVLNDATQEMGLNSIPRMPSIPSVRRTITDTISGAIDTTSQPASPASASTPAVPSVQSDGLPPAPDDPTLN